jgi:hypothetical protein
VRSSEVLVGKFHGERLTAYLRQIARSVESYRSVDIFTILIEGRSLRVAVLSADSVAASNLDDPAVIRGIVDRSKAGLALRRPVAVAPVLQTRSAWPAWRGWWRASIPLARSRRLEYAFARPATS